MWFEADEVVKFLSVEALFSPDKQLLTSSPGFIPRSLWADKDVSQSITDMRVAGIPNDGIVYALYNWCGIKNKTELGKLVKPDKGQTDRAYQGFVNKLLNNPTQKWHTE